MIRNRILVKTVAVFLILEMLVNSVAPTISWALTAGPTAPEATSFEPVDTTDMVNLNTGDMTYNLPLIEVPGPAGGYPLSLSYHAGTQLEEEASWTGLGWSVNPGSISRIVSGIADDFNGANASSRVFWEGGETRTQTYGVSFGIANFASVAAGVTFAQDTYRGFGVGGYVGVGLGFQLNKMASLGLNMSTTFSPYGGSYSTTSLGLSVGTAGASASVGLSVNSDNKIAAGFGGGITVPGTGNNSSKGIRFNAFDVSLASGGRSGVSVGMGGGSSIKTAEGQMSIYSSDFHLDVPVYYGINISIGTSYTRYWIDELETVQSYGSLYFPTSEVSLDSKAYDSYHLPTFSSSFQGRDPGFDMEGSFADYDLYSVNAQGIAGNFHPFHYTATLHHQDIDRDNGFQQMKGYYIPQHSQGLNFRFLNEFSNRVLNDAPEIEINKVFLTQQHAPNPQEADLNKENWKEELNQLYTNNQVVPLYFPYGNPQTGLAEYDGAVKRITPNVPGSRHIEYFTNEEIESNKNNQDWASVKGFIETTSKGFDRSTLQVEGKVGAFQITNSNGVVYHFSLPVYAFEEFSYSQNKNTEGGRTFNNLTQKGKYAYTWYLTAITGPDYIDRGVNGEADGKLNEYDWGYWVSFDYGKWAPSYQWRTPVEGFSDDVDSDFETFSKGKKELYYLNSIRTKTHTALFVKSLRSDGKSTTAKYDQAVATANNQVGWVDEGGFDVQNHFETTSINPPLSRTVYEYPVGVLRLDKILLFDNSSFDIDEENLYSSTTNYDHFEKKVFGNLPIDGLPIHLGKNVFDKFDLTANPTLASKAIRAIDFGYDYTLCPETPNSFDDESGSLYTYPFDSNIIQNKDGKLTLKSIAFIGKGGANAHLMPPIKFKYDIDDSPIAAEITSTNNSNRTVILSAEVHAAKFVNGDIVVFDKSGEPFYGYVKEKNPTSLIVKIISDELPSNGIVTGLKKTKNPPYNKELFDIWGNYKVDYKPIDNRNLDRFPSEISSKSADVWSLHEIETITGSKIKIEYESDTYQKSVYTQNLALPIQECDPVNAVPLDPLTSDALYIEALDPDLLYSFKDKYRLLEWVPVAFEVNVQPLNFFEGPMVITQAQVQLSEPGRVVLRTTLTDGAKYRSDPKGYLLLGSNRINYGGGLRVKSIGVAGSLTNATRYTTYEYDNWFFSLPISSGVTTYEPLIFFGGKYSNFLKEKILERFSTLLTLSRELPPPGVYYSMVRIGEKIEYANHETKILPHYTEYNFEEYNTDMLRVIKSDIDGQAASPSANTHGGLTFASVQTRKVSIENKTQRLGALKSIVLYDQNRNKITETLYSNGGHSVTQQGVVHETFNHARVIKSPYGSSTPVLRGIISKKITYPSIQIGSTTINYKTGIITQSQTLEYDFYSGQAIKSVTFDGYGNTYVTQTIPAYRKYPGMGLTIDGGMNLLTQDAASYVYKADKLNNYEPLGLLSASAQTWSGKIPVLNQSELFAETIVRLDPKISTGYFPATDVSQTPTLSPGERIEVALNGTVHVAKVMTRSTSSPWVYGLDIIGEDPLISSPLNNIPVKRISSYRKHKQFSYIGNNDAEVSTDGLVALNQVPVFDGWNTNVPHGEWQKNSEITLYNIYSHALEASDLNENYAATKMSYDQTKIFATAANSKYNEFLFAGAEESSVGGLFSGSVLLGQGEVDPTKSHTGHASLKLDGAEKGYEFSLITDPTPNSSSGRKNFQVSVWAHESNVSSLEFFYEINKHGLVVGPIEMGEVEFVVDQKKKAGSWYLLEGKISIPYNVGNEPGLEFVIKGGFRSSAGSVWIDDFRICPGDAAMTSYVYNEWGELSHILNNNNLFTRFEYDDLGRLIKTYKETFDYGVAKVSEQKYHYARQQN